jgi:hypothetical protein
VKFLIIDESLIVSTWRRMLADLADYVVFAECLDEAREKVAQDRFTIILCGGELPRVSGGPAYITHTEHFLREMFDRRSDPSPTVFCTATHPDNQERMTAIGCSAIIRKDGVPAMVRNIIKGSQQNDKP